MTSYADLIAKLKAADDSWESIGAQPETRVDEIESKYDIRLPRSFRQFLTEVGGIEYPNHYYTSIDEDYLDDQDGFMCNTSRLREQAGKLPDGLIALEFDHDADQLACLDLSRMVNGECPVIWCHAFQGRVVGACASSFDEFIHRLVIEWTS